MSAALQLLSQIGKSGVLHVNDPINNSDPNSQTVLDVQKFQRPYIQQATSDALIQSSLEPPQIHPIIYDRIDASCIYSAALGIDAHC